MFDFDSPLFTSLCNRLFHHGTRSKGERLYRTNQVIHCGVSHEALQCEVRAKVQGSAPQPYEVTVSCKQDSKAVYFTGKCTRRKCASNKCAITGDFIIKNKTIFNK